MSGPFAGEHHEISIRRQAEQPEPESFEDSRRLCAQRGASWQNERNVTIAKTYCGKTVCQWHSVSARSNPSIYAWCVACQMMVFGHVFR